MTVARFDLLGRLIYVNALFIVGTLGTLITPAILESWATLQWSQGQLGLVAALELVTLASGSLSGLYWQRRWPWRHVALVSLVLAIVANLACVIQHGFVIVCIARSAAGLAGGFLCAIYSAFLANTQSPGKVIAVTNFIMIGIEALFVFCAATVFQHMGSNGFFILMTALSAMLLPLLRFLPSGWPGGVRSDARHPSASQKQSLIGYMRGDSNPPINDRSVGADGDADNSSVDSSAPGGESDRANPLSCATSRRALSFKCQGACTMTISYELAEYLSLKKTIGAPVGRVWPVFLDMNRWYTDYHWDWISGPPYQGVGLQEGQVLKASPLYGVGMQDPTLYYLQEQVKVTPETEIVVKLTAANPKSMSPEYATEVRDVVAFYHWDFVGEGNSTTIIIRSYCNLRTDKRPAEAVLADLTTAFHRSWNKCLDKLETIVCDSSTQRTS